MNGLFFLRRVKWILLAGLLGLFIIGLAFSPVVDARAGADSGPQLSHPLLQSTNDYPPVPTYDPYPVGTLTPTTETNGEQPSITPDQPTETPTITMTPTDTATPQPNIFQTEDSEMGGSKVTPPASETPGSTSVATAAQSLRLAPTGTRSARVESAEKQNRFQVNWGMFWMGFALPVVAACGVVLYLLDRRPDLFRPKQK